MADRAAFPRWSACEPSVLAPVAETLAACAMVLCVGGGALRAAAKAEIDVARHVPCNLFDVKQRVAFDVRFSKGAPGEGHVLLRVTDYFGKEALSRRYPLMLDPRGRGQLALDLGPLPVGYYELTVAADVAGSSASAASSFGVARFADRTAAAFREERRRFGLKLWLVAEIWWNPRLTWRPDEVMHACAKTGLQWTRALLTQKQYMDTQALMRDYAMNVVLKVESFPENCFDEARYGDRETFRKTSRNHAWAKNTLPKKEPYQAWLRQQVRTVPEGQNVFEVWNEAWQWYKTLPVEDFARLCNWVVEAVKAERPDAIVGPNIHGDLTPYDLAFMRAGGLEGMDMVAVHPYTAGTPEEKGFRQRLRNYHDLLRREIGRDLDLYSTEYGWSTAPRADRRVSEAEQARRVVRESLMLYAEGVKTLLPHTMGQREHDPKDREHYFGFFRLTLQPKPVAMAFIACARAVDGSRFVGDLWLGPGVGAMVFERASVYTLALWTQDEARKIEVDAKSPEVTRLDIMGRPTKLSTAAGKLSVDLSGDVIYLVGVGKALADSAAPPTAPLRVERWKMRHDAPYAAARAAASPTIDGELGEWAAVTPITMANPKLGDIGARARLQWDDAALYVAVEMDDKHILNDREPTAIRGADCVDFHVCTRPDRQTNSRGLFDYNVVVAPTSKSGAPAFVLKNPAMRVPVVNPGPGHASGIRWASKRVEGGWTVEFTLPWMTLPGAQEGPLPELSFAVAVFDRDTTEYDEWKQWHKRVYNHDPKGSPAERPLLVLAGRRAVPR
jgi:hypothetical protein